MGHFLELPLLIKLLYLTTYEATQPSLVIRNQSFTEKNIRKKGQLFFSSPFPVIPPNPGFYFTLSNRFTVALGKNISVHTRGPQRELFWILTMSITMCLNFCMTKISHDLICKISCTQISEQTETREI